MFPSAVVMFGRFWLWLAPLNVAVLGASSTLPAGAKPHVPAPATVLNHTAVLLLPAYRDLVRLENNTDQAGRNYTYWLYPAHNPVEVVVERDGDRLLLVQRTEKGDRQLRLQGQVKSAFQVIGLPSRVFPGLTGVQRIPPETVPNWGLEMR